MIGRAVTPLVTGSSPLLGIPRCSPTCGGCDDAAMADTARRALLERLIDHAPLYPPASLPLEEALADHRRARESPHGWLVQRFVCPASKLRELGDEPLALSVVLDEDVPLDDPRIEAVELPPEAEPQARSLETYVEIRPAADLARLVAHGLRAKVRCGGTSVPSVDSLAGFVRRCREEGIPFKATAGLHHPVRRNGSHGFLNLLAASVFGDEERVLADEDEDAFRLDADVFAWRDHSATAAEIAVARGLFVAFGSCSFSEPVEDLVAMGFLPG